MNEPTIKQCSQKPESTPPAQRSSASEIILIEERTAKDFTVKINELRLKGYAPIGEFIKEDGFFYQMVQLTKSRLETKCQ